MKPPRKTSGQGVVIAMFVFIASIALGAWLLTQDSNEDSVFAKSLSEGVRSFNSGDLVAAAESFQRCLAMNPANPEIHHNLACCFLRTGQLDQALVHANEVLQIEPGNPAGLYLAGCVLRRDGAFSNAVQFLSQAKQVDTSVPEVAFELGCAYLGWNKPEAAAAEFREAIAADQNHPSAHLKLSETLAQLGQKDEAARELAIHQRLPGTPGDPSLIRNCQYNSIISISLLEQPSIHGIPVHFSDQTPSVIGADRARYAGPCELLDFGGQGSVGVLASLREGGLQVLQYSNGVLSATGPRIPSQAGRIKRFNIIHYIFGDKVGVLVRGETGNQLLHFSTNGSAFDVTEHSGLARFKVRAAAFLDLEPAGRQQLLVIDDSGVLRIFDHSNATRLETGPSIFEERNAPDRLPAVRGVTDITIEDLDDDGLPDAVLTRKNGPPLLLLNHRVTGLETITNNVEWPEANSIALGDLNNDKRIDTVLATDNSITIYYGGRREPRRLPARHNAITHLRLLDYDNDGWLDIVGWGQNGIHVWRNRGRRGFHEITTELGLASLANQPIEFLVTADFDNDGDSDWVIGISGAGLRYLRNDGGNANAMIKLRPDANVTNWFGPGLRLELDSGGWHTIRTFDSIPLGIGIGRRTNLESLSIHDLNHRWIESNLLADPHETHVLQLFERTMPAKK